MFFYPELIGIAFNDELLLNYQNKAQRKFEFACISMFYWKEH